MSPHVVISCSTLEVEAVRRDQFAEFAKAVQVGLLDYQGVQGIRALFSLMKSRYGNVRHTWSCWVDELLVVFGATCCCF